MNWENLMNWEIFWPVLIALLAALVVLNQNLNRQRVEFNKLLRKTLADYRAFHKDMELLENELDDAPKRFPKTADFLAFRHSTFAQQLTCREKFTEENLSKEIAAEQGLVASNRPRNNE